MTWRILGAIAAVIGTAGLLLSIYAGAATWSIARQIDQATDETLSQLQAIVDPVHQQSEAAVTLVGATRERFGLILSSVETLSGTEEPARPDTSAILETLDQHVLRRLDTAEDFIRTMQENMRNASSALLILDAVPFLSPRLTSSVDARESQLRSLAIGLTDLSDLLEQVTQTFAEIRSQSSIDPDQLATLRSGLGQIDTSLVELESEVRRFSEGIGRVKTILVDLRRQTPRRINGAAILATVFFICFGCSQLSLITHGCHMIRHRRVSSAQ